MQSFSKVKSTRPIRDKLSTYASYHKDDESNNKYIGFNDNITLKDISFGYDDESNFRLQSINLSIPKGGKFAIVGASGSGKSTLINLITGRETNYTGEILIDNVSIRDIGETPLNQLIAINHQNIFLFEGTVKDNICLFQECDQDKLDAALRKSGVIKFLPDLNESINTYIGENGNKLSGGQKQRIALARAFLQEKPILILDEGTSAIDLQTGFDIENGLLHDSNLTLITITHRLSAELLLQYDKIIVLENGTIKEIGSYEHVMRNNDLTGFFKHKHK